MPTYFLNRTLARALKVAQGRCGIEAERNRLLAALSDLLGKKRGEAS